MQITLQEHPAVFIRLFFVFSSEILFNAHLCRYHTVLKLFRLYQCYGHKIRNC